jgi:hypothetical protein
MVLELVRRGVLAHNIVAGVSIRGGSRYDEPVVIPTEAEVSRHPLKWTFLACGGVVARRANVGPAVWIDSSSHRARNDEGDAAFRVSKLGVTGNSVTTTIDRQAENMLAFVAL